MNRQRKHDRFPVELQTRDLEAVALERERAGHDRDPMSGLRKRGQCVGCAAFESYVRRDAGKATGGFEDRSRREFTLAKEERHSIQAPEVHNATGAQSVALV